MARTRPRLSAWISNLKLGTPSGDGISGVDSPAHGHKGFPIVKSEDLAALDAVVEAASAADDVGEHRSTLESLPESLDKEAPVSETVIGTGANIGAGVTNTNAIPGTVIVPSAGAVVATETDAAETVTLTKADHDALLAAAADVSRLEKAEATIENMRREAELAKAETRAADWGNLPGSTASELAARMVGMDPDTREWFEEDRDRLAKAFAASAAFAPRGAVAGAGDAASAADTAVAKAEKYMADVAGTDFADAYRHVLASDPQLAAQIESERNIV